MLTRAEVFDYSTVPADKAASARAAAERIRGRMQLAAESIIEVGRELIQQKKDLGHGNFLAWIDAEFGMSTRTSQNFISVAERFSDKYATVAHLAPTALYALAAPSTPEPVREQVLERAASGEKVTAKEIEKLKKDLEKATTKLEDANGQVLAMKAEASVAVRQRNDAQAKLMYAQSDAERVQQELDSARDELSRLQEEGVIHILPAATPPAPDTVSAAIAGAEAQFRADVDAAIMNLKRVWQSADDDWRQAYLDAARVQSLGSLV